MRVLMTYAPPRPNPSAGDKTPQGARVTLAQQQPSKHPSPIDVQSFVESKFTRYEGDASFLAGPTESTKLQMTILDKLLLEEQDKGILDVDTVTPSSITAFPPGYIDPEHPELERIKGLQTDKPLKRAIKPLGGVRTVAGALEAYGYTLDEHVDEIFSKYRKTHNQGDADGLMACLYQHAAQVFSTSTLPRCVPRARLAFSPACPTATVAAASSVTTDVSPSTAWTPWSLPKKTTCARC